MEKVWLVVIVGAAVAGFVQGLSGFAFGLVAMSFWAWVLDPRLAAVLAVCGALMGQVLTALSVRRGFDLKVLLPFLVGGLLGVPVGAALLPAMDMDWFKALLGLLLIVWCPAMLAVRHLPQVRSRNRVANALVGFGGGVMAAFGGFAGVLPTLWCTLSGYGKDEQRSVIQNFSLTILTTTFASYVFHGLITREALMLLLAAAPAILVAGQLGARLYARVSQNVFRTVVLGLLTVSGLVYLVSSVPHLLARG